MKANELTARQRAVIEDLVRSSDDEIAVLKRNGVATAVYRRWLAKERYVEELEFRLEGVRRDGRRLLAQSAGEAARKLVGFLEEKKPNSETLRKACVDIIKLGVEVKKEKKVAVQKQGVKGREVKIDEETARRVLAALAKG